MQDDCGPTGMRSAHVGEAVIKRWLVGGGQAGASRSQQDGMEASRSRSSAVSSISASMDEDSGKASATHNRAWLCGKGREYWERSAHIQGWAIWVAIIDDGLNWPSCEATRLRLRLSFVRGYESRPIPFGLGRQWYPPLRVALPRAVAPICVISTVYICLFLRIQDAFQNQGSDNGQDSRNLLGTYLIMRFLSWLWGAHRAGQLGPNFGMSTVQTREFIPFSLTQVEMRYVRGLSLLGVSDANKGLICLLQVGNLVSESTIRVTEVIRKGTIHSD